ncbi:hypothetical protein DXG01_005732 [Tephrocybe rancida]|nr:hypothetical protein DXG01_005732 [Tephrocybe rancida]
MDDCLAYDPDQDPNEKRAVRRDYRSLAKIFQDRQSQPDGFETRHLTKQVLQADSLFDNVKAPSEAILDSNFLLMASTMGAQRARAVKMGSAFDADEFIAKLVHFMGGHRPLDDQPGEESGDIHADGYQRPLKWSKIGHRALAKSRRVSVMSFMLGPLSIEHKQRAAAKRSRLQKNAQDLRRPQELQEADLFHSQNETAKNVAVLETMLRDLGKTNIFKLIINPNDFAQSVVNLFYLSFLIRDGKAAYETDNNNEPVVCVCDQPTDEQYQSGELQKRQIISKFSMATHAISQRAIEVFEITESKIPQRLPVRTLGDKWYG